MGRSAKDRSGRGPQLPPVEHIELSGKHKGKRAVLALLLLVIGIASLTYAIVGLTRVETGWQIIEVNTSAGQTCGDDFGLLYQVSSRSDYNGVRDCYSKACKKAFQLFHSDMEFQGVTNLTAINLRPNEVLAVDKALYDALAEVAASGRRELYLGPVYERYDDLFFCQSESQAADFDPRLNEEVRAEYTGVLAYANDPQAICLEMLDGNRVRLNVSEAYLAWAKEQGVGKFIDFSWMRNAFIADYLAGELTAGGYTAGVLNSVDGFTRNLDGRGVEYTYPLYSRWKDTIYSPAELHYTGPMSLARMQDYPLSAMDLQRYYQLSSGEIRTMYLDPADALCKSAVDTLLCCSGEKGCGELLLEMIPIYIADQFQEDAIPMLASKGVQSIYCQEDVVRYTDPEAKLENFFQRDGVQYTAELIALP